MKTATISDLRRKYGGINDLDGCKEGNANSVDKIIAIAEADPVIRALEENNFSHDGMVIFIAGFARVAAEYIDQAKALNNKLQAANTNGVYNAALEQMRDIIEDELGKGVPDEAHKKLYLRLTQSEGFQRELAAVETRHPGVVAGVHEIYDRWAKDFMRIIDDKEASPLAIFRSFVLDSEAIFGRFSVLYRDAVKHHLTWTTEYERSYMTAHAGDVDTHGNKLIQAANACYQAMCVDDKEHLKNNVFPERDLDYIKLTQKCNTAVMEALNSVNCPHHGKEIAASLFEEALPKRLVEKMAI